MDSICNNLCTPLRKAGGSDNTNLLSIPANWRDWPEDRLFSQEKALQRKQVTGGYKSDCLFKVGGLRDVADNSRIELCEK